MIKKAKETGLTNRNKGNQRKNHTMKHVIKTVNQSEVEANTWNGVERQARENALKFRGLGLALTTSWSCFMEDQCLTSLTHVNSQ